jgi:RNA polymerase sigma-70 factor (ECF subfamily)
MFHILSGFQNYSVFLEPNNIKMSAANNANTETVLILQLKEGSSKAFDNIYRMYAKRLYAYCLQFTKSPEDSEEIVQNVFVKLWTNRKRIRQEDTLPSLLRRK